MSELDRGCGLKPCPFCGQPGLHPHRHLTAWVRCGSCGAEGPVGTDRAEAIDAWNRRARDLAHRQLAERAHRLGGYTLTEYDLDGEAYRILVVEASGPLGIAVDAVAEIAQLTETAEAGEDDA